MAYGPDTARGPFQKQLRCIANLLNRGAADRRLTRRYAKLCSILYGTHTATKAKPCPAASAYRLTEQPNAGLHQRGAQVTQITLIGNALESAAEQFNHALAGAPWLT